MSNNLSKPTIIFHWATGIAFLSVVSLGFYLGTLPRGAEKMEIMGLHKSLGAIVFVIAVIRIIWRFKEGSISSISTLPKWQTVLANGIHHLLLLATILMPVSGLLMSIGGGRAIEVFGLELMAAGGKIEWLAALAHTVHVNAVNVVIVALVLHIAGGFKHQFIDKDGTISRMLGNFHKD